MYQEFSINLLRFLLSLSDVLDLASPELANHQLRTAYIAWRIGEAAQLPPHNLEPVFFAALLHDVGALSPEEKVAIHESREVPNLDEHCVLGEKVLSRSPAFQVPARIVRRHHTPWEEWEDPNENLLCLQSQILHVADTVERAIDRDIYILHQDRQIVSEIASFAGTEFHRGLVEVFKSVASREEFWLDLVSPHLCEILFERAPGRNQSLAQSSFLAVSELIRDIIDFRSRFTATHSSGVSAAGAALAQVAGFSESDIELMEIVGNLHDLGKMAVPNRILEKPHHLLRDEFAIIRRHTYYTYTFLTRSGFSDHIAEWAGFHHERLDGTGYPFHVDSRRINLGCRIVSVADVFTALAETRPYRKRLDAAEVIAKLQEMTKTFRLDPHVVDLLARNYDFVLEQTQAKQSLAEDYYTHEFGNHGAQTEVSGLRD